MQQFQSWSGWRWPCPALSRKTIERFLFPHINFLLLATDGAMSSALCPQVVSQVPHHFISSKTQAACNSCFTHQSVFSAVSEQVIQLHSVRSVAMENDRSWCHYHYSVKARTKEWKLYITIREQNKSETYLTQTVALRWHHGEGFPIATNRTSRSDATSPKVDHSIANSGVRSLT